MGTALDKFSEAKARLSAVGPGFCMAKWQQVTMHLHNGTNHSCHHPHVHSVSVDELNDNINALHNSEYKKAVRKQMLNGERPSECQYCWNIEDSSGEVEMFSDRHVKSAYSTWNRPEHFAQIINSTGDEDFYPSYLEVSFSNRCNLKCSYCGPVYSSTWQEEIKYYGNYNTLSGFNSGHEISGSARVDEDSPHLIAFKQWWPSAKPHVKVLRMTGGEPLLEKTTFSILSEVAESDVYQDIEISVNSNLSVSRGVIEKFNRILYDIVDKVREIRIYTSCEANGKQAEYIRYGLEYEKWLSNLDYLMTQNPKVKFTVMSTVNNLSITSLRGFCEDMLTLKLKHINDHRKVPVSISFNILRYPQHQRLDILPENVHHFIDEVLEYLKANQEGTNGNDYYHGFFDYEINAFERLFTFMKGKNSDLHSLVTARRDFYNFFTQHDERRGTNFGKTFPELVPFMESCKALNENLISVKEVK